MRRIQSGLTFRICMASLIVGILMSGAHFTYINKITKLQVQLERERNTVATTRAKQDEQNKRYIEELTALSEQATLTQWRMRELVQLERNLRHLTRSDGIIATIPQSTLAAGGLIAIPDPLQIPAAAEQVKSKYDSLLKSVAHITVRYQSMVDTFTSLDAQIRQTPLMWPTESRLINSTFGFRTDPFTKKSAQHNGIDLHGETGDPVYATADGIVVKSDYDPLYGNHLLIEHSQAYSTTYMHMSQLFVQSGDRVARGDQIGTIGSTGRSTGPHLHYEIYHFGEIIDPQPYLVID